MTAKPKILTADEFREIIRQELTAHDERLGRDTSSIAAREEIRKDAEWTRTQRKRMDAIASKVGYAVLGVIITAMIAIFAAGMKRLHD